MTLSLVFASSCPAYEYYEAGKKAFSDAEYEKAGRYLKQAVKNHPHHLQCRYYYARTLTMLKDFDNARKQYEKITEISPLSHEARLAITGIADIEKFKLAERGLDINSGIKTGINPKIYFKSGDNYIENALEGGKVTRWNSEKMPIKLYIERPMGLAGYKDSYYTEVKRAMDTWINSAGNNLISCKLTESPEEANVRVYFVGEILKKTGKGYITGLATPYIRGHILDYYEVKFIPHDSLYTTALHELGHALGIRGHSSNESDIMYASVNDARGLSQRDKNTLSLLYTLDPHMSNFDPGEKVAENSAKNEKLLGPTDELLDKKLREAIEYTEKYPNNVLSWVHLGKAYYDQEKYDLARISLEKALEIDPSYTKALENLALVHKELGNTAEAGNIFKKLVGLEPGNIASANNYAYFLIENNRLNEAELVLENLFRHNPGARDDENIKKLADYLKSGSYDSSL